MAEELLAGIRKLRELPEPLHWFCPRQTDEDRENYDDDLLAAPQGVESGKRDVEKQKAVEAGQERRSLAINTLQLFALEEDNKDAVDWFKQHLDIQLSRCDKCTMAYHRGKKFLMRQLREEHEEEDLQHFFEAIETWDVERLEPKLEAAAQSLRSAPTDRRNLHWIDVQSVFAMWEVLSDASFLKHESLTAFFDETFELVQSNKLFRSPTFFPLLTTFLFDPSPFRVKWAVRSWSKMKKSPSPDEFNWAIREPLLQAMRRVSNLGIEPDFIMKFWCGAKLIIETLDKSLITHSLRGMEVDLYRLALDHLQLDMPVFRVILQVIRTLLVISPEDFWSAMGVITPITLVQVIFRSPQCDSLMVEVDDMPSWAVPLIESLKPASRPSTCREAVSQLMKRWENNRYPPNVRTACRTESLRIILLTLSGFVDMSFPINTSVDWIVVAEAMDIVNNNIEIILDAAATSPDRLGGDDSSLALDVLRNALTLDSKSLKASQEALERGRLFHLEGLTYSRDVWELVLKRFMHNNVSFAANVLLGIMPLIGLERFKVKQGAPDREAKLQFNNVYGHLIETVSQIFGRLSEFESIHLGPLFQIQGCANCLVGALFCAEQSIHQAAIDVTKQISGTVGRKEAISYLLENYFITAMRAFCWAMQLIKIKRTFASTPRMLKTCGDVLDVLCDSQIGLLRRDASGNGPDSLELVERFWEYQWHVLAIIFEMTETWGSQYDKEILGEFARDTIQYGEKLFDQYSIFERAIESSGPQQGDQSSTTRPTSAGRTLLEHPTATMTAMVRWLRLRDDYLLNTLVSLVCKLLRRLGESGIKIGSEALRYVEDGAKGKQYRNVLTRQQKAELLRAVDEHQGRRAGPSPTSSGHGKTTSQTTSQTTISDPSTWPNVKRTSESARSKIDTRPGIIDLDLWRSKAKSPSAVITLSDDEYYGDVPDEDMLAASGAVEIPKEPAAANAPVTIPTRSARVQEVLEEEAKLSFRQKREKEQAEKKKRDAAQIAIQRKKLAPAGVAALTAEEGSGLNGIGVKGKDHAPPQSSIMVSDDSSSSEDGEGGSTNLFKMRTTRTSRQVQEYRDSKARALNAHQQKPVRKVKQTRSMKDQRARLAPDLTALHKTILSWDFFYSGQFPPNSERNDYSMISSIFKSPAEYQATFEPLLVLEAWQGFLKAREEDNFKSFNVKVANRMTVDAFIEVNTSMSLADGKELGIMEADIILLSRAEQPIKEPKQPHCLARVHSIARKKAALEISYRVNPGGPFVGSLAPNVTIRGTKVVSITPLEREYGALVALQYYDLCDEIVKAKPSPLLEYSDRHLKKIQDNYNVNRAQAKAVASAMDNDAFTLIQGPPGSGKTKTIVAIVGALLTDTPAENALGPGRLPDSSGLNLPRPNPKKLLVCAPSNAAVDELVIRFKQGVTTLAGEVRKLSVVRLGRSDAINAAVRDVTLEELVKVKAGATSKTPNQSDQIHQLVEEHKGITEAINATRTALEEAREKGSPTVDLNRTFDLQKRKKSEIGRRLDNLRDAGNTAARDAEIRRKKLQQEILDNASIICSTLSGSGHEMMRNINIEFETVIIDEAAQSIELSALIPLKYGCSKCILVGDPKQLPPTVLSREAARFQYEQSLFVRMQTNHPTYVHLLDTQYRMHPEISQYPSKSFYDGKLMDGENMAKIREKPWHVSELLGPYRFFDVQGQHTNASKGHSLINKAEVNVAVQLFERLTTDYKEYDFRGKIGIITPYKSQLSELKSRFLHLYGDSILTHVEFNTTDAFQGRESEVIIFSCVRASSSRGIGFLADIRRMNVGLTRAKSSLWVLGNSQSLVHGEFWGNLIKDAKSRECYTDGDITTLLQRPTTKLATGGRPREVTMSNTLPDQLCHSPPGDIEMEDAPPLESPDPSDIKPSFQSNPTDEDGSPQPYRPPRQNRPPIGITCNICGSDAHYAPNCTNSIARAAALGTCSRCGDPHFGSCSAVRCSKCGKLGHTIDACVSSTPLPKVQREEIQRQETAHEARNQKHLEKMRKKQLGGHDPKVPTIVTAPPRQPRGETRNKSITSSDPRLDGKRKRGTSPHELPDVLIAPKSNKTTSQQKPLEPNPEQQSPDSIGLGDQIPQKSIKPTIIARPGTSAAPRPPPPPPRKKKEVDPFIRPNRKRPKP